MSRYIYDELKEEFKDLNLRPGFIFSCMASITHKMGYTAPGEIPEDQIETFKQQTEELIRTKIKMATKITISAMKLYAKIKEKKEKPE